MSDDKLELIRKLLAKAEATEFEHERDAFNARAADLIAKYGIDQALLANAGEVRDVVGDRIVLLHGPYLVDKAVLLNRVSMALRVDTVRRTNTRTRDTVEMHLFGFAADLERVELLFTSLLVQVGFGLAKARPPWGESVAAYRRTWLAGFTNAIYDRLTAAERRAAREADAAAPDGQPGTALVLAGRQEQVALAKKAAYPRLTSGRARYLTGSGYRSGQEAGRRVDLGGTRVGSGSARSIDR